MLKSLDEIANEFERLQEIYSLRSVKNAHKTLNLCKLTFDTKCEDFDKLNLCDKLDAVIKRGTIMKAIEKCERRESYYE